MPRFHLLQLQKKLVLAFHCYQASATLLELEGGLVCKIKLNLMHEFHLIKHFYALIVEFPSHFSFPYANHI